MREVAGLHGVEEGGYAGVLKNFVPLRVADRDVGDPVDESYKKQNNASYKSHCHSAAPFTNHNELFIAAGRVIKA